MSNELRPCPFCGGEVTFGSVRDSTHYWYIGCENCDYTHFYFGTKKEVIEKWNTRPAEDALQAEIERLKLNLDASKSALKIAFHDIKRLAEEIDNYKKILQDGENKQ